MVYERLEASLACWRRGVVDAYWTIGSTMVACVGLEY